MFGSIQISSQSRFASLCVSDQFGFRLLTFILSNVLVGFQVHVFHIGFHIGSVFVSSNYYLKKANSHDCTHSFLIVVILSFKILNVTTFF